MDGSIHINTINHSLQSINITEHNNESLFDQIENVANAHACHTVILVILSSTVIILNGFLIVLFIADRKLRKQPANILICSQVCADLYTGIIFLPLYVIKNSHLDAVEPFLSCYMLFVQLFSLLALSIDRYLAFIKPFLHHKLMDRRYIRKIVTCVWSIPLLFTVIPLFWWFEERELKGFLQRIYVGTIWSIILVIVLIVTLLYIIITKHTRQSIRGRMSTASTQMCLFQANSPHPNRRGKTKYKKRNLAFRRSRHRSPQTEREHLKAVRLARKELRVVHLFALLLASLVAAYSPILYINIFVHMLRKPMFISSSLICISLYSLILNSLVTPILCIMLKKDFVKAIKKQQANFSFRSVNG